MSFNKTNIGWCDRTFNPISGCLNKCNYCYAEKLANTRLKNIYPYGFEPTFYPKKLEKNPPKEPSMIFVGSMGDLFGLWGWQTYPQTDKTSSNGVIRQILEYCEKYQEHVFQFLTKSPRGLCGWRFPQNCWVGVTVTNHDDFKRVSTLNEVNCETKFISFEPLLQPYELLYAIDYPSFENIDWCIIGLQTGPGGHKYNEDYKKYLEIFIDKLKQKNKRVFIKNNVNKIYPELVDLKEFPAR